jgi:hypothetical protein
MSHEHEHVWESDRREASREFFADRKHDARDLSRWACEYIEGVASLSCADRQREARDRLRSGGFDKLWFQDGHTTEDVTKAFFNVFDEPFFFFFFGSLTKKCIITYPLGAEWLGNTVPLVGNTIEGDFACNIKLSPKSTGNLHRDREILLIILLHEMCHAFLSLYACGQPPCEKTHDGEGRTGHGRAWEKILRAVQNSINQDFNMKLDFKIDKLVKTVDKAWNKE